ncbi:FAD-dependent oxidoreductase [Spiroplasma platyhelix]|uniref:FAD-dependent oxidoreductase n=1 Tax=Spiroplasma platyhelix PALS-1 TaxID=1276218 RepID=A0A846TQZ8_9MOLU|nr:FAD-dependent oxidoreductase [Spiroplasma platyhelix]MBE4704398.1 putative NADH oxidase [Spiroplasma platyhelix PALS-1]NKE38770.1 FAD-dependent oxidoreductase [Spiroplasma platyhelix PALS-1]UJB28981.1 NADH oxidase [Spiroplasma platyhelix PALS-1]
MNKKTKVVLIGINHAGTTAVKALIRNNPNAEVVAYDRNDNISFLGCGIALWVGKEFSNPKGLFYATAEKLAAMGVNIKMSHEMTKLDVSKKTLEIKNLKTNETITETYDKLILAIGSWPILNPGGKEIPGLLQLTNGQPTEDFLNGYKLTKGIHLSKLYQHAQLIIEHLNKPEVKNIVVIGAGYIGIELVEAFVKVKKQVTLIDFESRIMPRYYDPEFTNDLETEMKKNGVKLQLGETLERFTVENNQVAGVVTNKGNYPADLVIMAVGFLPNTSVLKNTDGSTQLNLDARGAIVVNQYFQTSNPDVYAIGDCIAIHSNAWGKDVNIALATNAVRSGLVAGLNISTDNKVPFPGVQGTNAIAVFGWKLAATGLSEISAKAILGKDNIEAVYYQDTAFPPFMKENHLVKIKIIWEKESRRIVGAEIGSTQDHTEVIFMFSLAIMKNLTIDEIALIDMYFLPHFNKPYNYVTAAALLAMGILKQEDIVYPDPYQEENKKKELFSTETIEQINQI